MQAIFSNVKLLAPVFIVPWVLLFSGVLLKPQRLRNSFLLLLAIGTTLLFIAGLFGDHMEDALLGMFLLCAAVLFLVPVLLVANGVQMLRRERRTVGNLLSLLLGVVIGVGEVCAVLFVLNLGSFESLTQYRVVCFGFFSVFYFSVLILAFVLYSMLVGAVSLRRRFDYIIIHGSGLLHGDGISKLLANRLDKAMAVYRRCAQPPMLIASGGKGADETISEAQAMAQYLMDHGVPRQQILLEERSHDTRENLAFSKAIIDARSGGKRTALVTSCYHVYRCLYDARRLNLRCSGIGAPVAWYYLPSALIREAVAVFLKPRYIVLILVGYVLFVGIPLLISLR